MKEQERPTTHERLRAKPGFRNAMLIFGLAMTIFYLVMGAYLLLEKRFLAWLSSDLRNIFAGMLLIYGLYRGYRVYADYYKTDSSSTS
jgi:hypothetical protein